MSDLGASLLRLKLKLPLNLPLVSKLDHGVVPKFGQPLTAGHMVEAVHI